MWRLVSVQTVTHINIGLNRYDFNLCLKTGKLREGSLKSSGSLFQSAGPEVAKASWPNRFCFCSRHKIVCNDATKSGVPRKMLFTLDFSNFSNIGTHYFVKKYSTPIPQCRFDIRSE